MNNISDKALLQKQLTEKQPFSWLQKRVFCIVIALLGLLLILVVMTINVAKYETHLATGDTVLLALAPVDPRGFMQGDYMALSYALERDIFAALRPEKPQSDLDNSENLESLQPNFQPYEPSQGYVIVKIDVNNVGRFVRLGDSNSDANNNNNEKLAANERAIYYRIRHGSVQLATNAFFFQEGHAKAFEAAEYGLFRINDKGEPLLTEMVDSNFQIIKGKAESAVDSSP
ncbi:GDYXXLXY domain-containing protein [Psychrobacter glacincola]|uniref:GDYXXLXY domain-containing protein n=1 Tax=Psychrobacter glacincola TaxID=56810 RepID=UPI0039AEE3CB